MIYGRLYNFLCYFYIYGFLGWCLEVTYVTVCKGKFVNRGFLNGPVCPVYGFGAVSVIAALTPLKENLLALYFGSVLLTSFLELVTGFAVEKIFHQRLWNYSRVPFNIGGYICLKFSLGWGFACLFTLKIIHPVASELVRILPNILGNILLAVFTVFFVIDIISTTASVSRLNMKLSQIEEISEKIKERSDALGHNISGEVLELKERYNRLLEQRNYFNARFFRAFPNIKSTRHFEALEELKRRFKIRKRKN